MIHAPSSTDTSAQMATEKAFMETREQDGMVLDEWSLMLSYGPFNTDETLLKQTHKAGIRVCWGIQC